MLLLLILRQSSFIKKKFLLMFFIGAAINGYLTFLYLPIFRLLNNSLPAISLHDIIVLAISTIPSISVLAISITCLFYSLTYGFQLLEKQSSSPARTRASSIVTTRLD